MRMNNQPTGLPLSRNRIIYGSLIIGMLLLGLASRRFFGDILFVRAYVGDALWALMIFFSFAFLFNRWSTKAVALVATLFCFGIETGQLYHAPWIDELRATRLGGLILGFMFGWSDLVCYSVGVIIGVLTEICLNRQATHRR